MLKELKLTNYRQHEDRTFRFEEGLNVMRGVNEAGKSTILSAMLYLWLGLGAVEGTLAEIVTYGKEEKTLRVEGKFSFEGIDFEMYRSKSGAQINYSDKTVTGQSECTRFMERLLGAKADVVKNLMVAEQNSVRGILKSDTDAGALIEKLADLDLIERLITKIQAQHPTGPTKAQEQLVFSLNDSVGEEPVPPTNEALEQAKLPMLALTEEVVAMESKVSEAKVTAEAAEKVLKQSSEIEIKINTLSKRKADLEAVQEPETCKFSAEDLAYAERIESDFKFAEKVGKERAKTFETCDVSWTGDEKSALDEIKRLDAHAATLRREASKLREQASAKAATRINEGICSFCKIDISQRPEVIDQNSAVDSAVIELRAKSSDLEAQAESAKQDSEMIADIVQMHRRNLAKATPDFWQVQVGTVPSGFDWIGPVTDDNLSLSVSSTWIRSTMRAYETALNRHTAAQQELASLEIPERIPAEAVQTAHADFERFKTLSAELQELTRQREAAKAAYNQAVANYEGEVKVFNLKVQQRLANIARIEDARDQLAKMVFNNQLIKDLRDARGDIRRKLWQSVTATISVYFSRIRNVETVIAQGEKGFTQNGQPVKGLSGSALDMLGLAMRAALVKTFIPGATLMVTDEPFSGCDDQRETAGIGVLASLGFGQTILVTHSDLADAVADNLVAV